ncbi:MAG: T9SS type A sorting domain-containing protein [Flavobacteriales bacterium]
MHHTLHLSSVLLLGLASTVVAKAQTLAPDFVSAGYTLSDLGSITDLPTPYGGLTIRTDEPNTLYIGGSANAPSGAVYTVPLLRDPVTQAITGFGGPAVLHASAPNIDGGLSFTPEGTLMFTQYTPFTLNSIGQVLPDNSYVTTQLTSLGIAASVGSHAFVPAGYPGAGGLIIASYNGNVAYRVPFTVDAAGQYSFATPTASVDVLNSATGPEGIAYVPFGSAGFFAPSMVVSAYGMNKVVVFEIDPDGLPIPATVRDMVTGLVGAEGAWIDPLTGDFLFSTFGGSNRVIKVSGFELPTAIETNNALNDGSLSVFPNPSNGSFQLAFAGATDIVHVDVIDPMGALVHSKTLPPGELHALDLSGQAPGVYAIHARCAGRRSVQRVVLE